MDPLSALARSVLRLNAGHTYESLVVIGPVNTDAQRVLAELTPEAVVSQTATNRPAAAAALAGLWLWHDFLDESHALSQSLHLAEGSFWHAIMHRREGDFSNAKYWYARCANHPIYTALTFGASDIINPFPASKEILRLNQNGWNPNAFVDLVECVQDQADDPHHRLCVALQQLEWRMLFDYCVRVAISR